CIRELARCAKCNLDQNIWLVQRPTKPAMDEVVMTLQRESFARYSDQLVEQGLVGGVDFDVSDLRDQVVVDSDCGVGALNRPRLDNLNLTFRRRGGRESDLLRVQQSLEGLEGFEEA